MKRLSSIALIILVTLFICASCAPTPINENDTQTTTEPTPPPPPPIDDGEITDDDI